MDHRELRAATFQEERYCFEFGDKKHGSRKRKICLACRNRIDVEEKWRRLEETEVGSDRPRHMFSHLFRVYVQKLVYERECVLLLFRMAQALNVQL